MANKVAKYWSGQRLIKAEFLHKSLPKTPFSIPSGGIEIFTANRIHKYLIVVMAGYELIFHPGQTGLIDTYPSVIFDNPIHDSADLQFKENHVRARYYLDDGQVWFIFDQRAWSKHWLVRNPPSEIHHRLFDHLGPDAFHAIDDPATFDHFRAKMRSGSKIHTVITSPSTLGGIGNYLACESLFAASLFPFRRAKDLSVDEVVVLFISIREVVREAMEATNYSWFRVFQRRGLPCKREGCEGQVIRGVIGSRGIYHCPQCQPSLGR